MGAGFDQMTFFQKRRRTEPMLYITKSHSMAHYIYETKDASH